MPRETLFGHDQRFFSRQRVQGRFVEMQVCGYQFRGSVAKPLGEGQILVVGAFEHFKELQVGRAGVFDVVRESFWM